MSNATADAQHDERRRGQQRTLRFAMGLVLVGLAVGAALGAHIGWYDVFFVAGFLALLSYYSDWVVKRPRWRIAVLIVFGACVVASLVSEFV